MGDDLLTIRQMCDAYDVTPRTLRFYESRELIFPQRQGQHRLYSRRDRARLTLILRGKRFGFSLEDIRQWLLIYGEKGTREQYRVWIDLATRQLEVLAQQRDEIDQAIADLRALKDETAALLRDMPQDGSQG